MLVMASLAGQKKEERKCHERRLIFLHKMSSKKTCKGEKYGTHNVGKDIKVAIRRK